MRFSKTTVMLGAVFIAFVFFCLGYFSSVGRVAGSYSIVTAASGVRQAAEGVSGSDGDFAQSAPAARNAAGADGTQTPETAGPVNINTASAEELETLPGIGATLSQRIVAYRDTYGAFKSIIDLKNVEGIGDKRFEAIESMICVD